MAGLQKTYSGDLSVSIAKRLIEANTLAHEGKKDAMDVANFYGVDPMLRRGEFLGHGLGAAFTQFLPRPFQHNMPNVSRSDPSYIARGQRSTALYGQSSPLPPRSPWPGPFGGGGGGINPEVVPNDTILGKMINVTPGRGRSGGIVVHDQKLGKFVAAVGESLSSSMNSMSTKADGIDQGVIAAKDGLTATQKQLEDVGSTLEDKLDAIIAEIRGQNNLLRKQEEDAKEEKKEAEIEERDITPAEGSGTDRYSRVGEDLRETLAENNAEDAAAIASQQKLLPPGRQEAERGAFIAHGKELVGDRVIDGPDTGYLAQAEQGSTSVTPINNFFTRGQTGAASKTGGMPSGKPVTGRKISSIGNIPEVKKETEKLAKAAVLPVQASGAMTLGVLGQSMGEMGGLAGEKGVETGIKKIASPIAGMFGVKNSIANNVAGEVGSAADAAKRSADTAAGVANKATQNNMLFDMVGNTINWVKGLFVKDESTAEKGGVYNTTTHLGSNRVSISAEKGATIIKGSKKGYPVNIGGKKITAHGTELVTQAEKGVQITPLDNYATDGIPGNEVTPGGDLMLDSQMSFERGGRLTPSRIREQRAQQAAMNAPPSTKSQIVQLNSKEREFKRMLTKVTKTDPIVINSTNSKTDPPPQEMAHISNVGDPGLDVIYPSLV